MRELVSLTNAKPVPLTTIAHPTESSWQSARMVTVFQSKVPVLAFVVPTGSAVPGAGATATLSAIALPDLSACVKQIKEEVVKEEVEEDLSACVKRIKDEVVKEEEEEDLPPPKKKARKADAA